MFPGAVEPDSAIPSYRRRPGTQTQSARAECLGPGLRRGDGLKCRGDGLKLIASLLVTFVVLT